MNKQEWNQWMEQIPKGWVEAFGDMMYDEIKDYLGKNFEDWHIDDAKEKFGALRIYHHGESDGSNVDRIIDKYSVLSENTCSCCGKPDVGVTKVGWIMPVCEKCYKKLPRYSKDSPQDTHERYMQEVGRGHMGAYMYWSTYDKNSDKWVDHKQYIGKTAKAIRERWKKRHGGKL